MNKPDAKAELAQKKQIKGKKLDPKAELARKARIEAAEKVERGDVAHRFVASTLDFCVFYLVKLSLEASIFVSIPDDQLSFKHHLLIWFLVFVFIVLYNGFLISIKGATLGKMTMHLQIADLNTGLFPDFKSANLREFAKILSAAMLMYGLIMIVLRKDQRALHDLMLNTVVVKVS